MKKFGLILVGLFVTAGSAFAADGERTVLATQKYVDSMYDVIDAVKADKAGLGTLASKNAVSGGAGGTITDGTITDDDISADAAIDLTKIAVPASCATADALCVLAFQNGAWTVVDVTADPETTEQ